MLYYRYRPISELTLKELRYDELYFSSNAEKNDPYDGKVFLSYDFDKDKWKRFLECTWHRVFPKDKMDEMDKLTIPMSEYLADNPPSTYEKMMAFNFAGILRDRIPSMDSLSAYNLDAMIKQFVDIYRPGGQYSVSFSKSNDNLLLWSHYASQHKGFCLIFKTIDGFLHQDKMRATGAVRRETPLSFSPRMTFGIQGFDFQDIKYCSELEAIDASRYMTPRVFGKDFSSREPADEEERIAFINENNSKCLEKHECWKYEEEVRILLREPAAWLAGQQIPYTQEERLFHFEPTQLVGIIFGALMPQEVKSRIRQIISRKIDRISVDCKGKAVYDFVFFEAKISDRHRNVDIVPVEIAGFLESVIAGSPEFESRFNNWQDGWCILYSENGGGKRQFKHNEVAMKFTYNQSNDSKGTDKNGVIK